MADTTGVEPRHTEIDPGPPLGPITPPGLNLAPTYRELCSPDDLPVPLPLAEEEPHMEVSTGIPAAPPRPEGPLTEHYLQELPEELLPIGLDQAQAQGLLSEAVGFTQAGWDEWTLIQADGQPLWQTIRGNLGELLATHLEEVRAELTFVALDIAQNQGRIPSLICLACQEEGGEEHASVCSHAIFSLTPLELLAVKAELRDMDWEGQA